MKDEDLRFEAVIIFYWIAQFFRSQDKLDSAERYADMVIRVIRGGKGRRPSYLDEEGLRSIRLQMEDLKGICTRAGAKVKAIPIVNDPKPGRNQPVKVKYDDGSVVEAKYKKVEADISAGRCVIID